MDSMVIQTTVEQITTNGTIPAVLMAIGGLICAIVIAYCAYAAGRFFNGLWKVEVERENLRISRTKNANYLDDLYTSYKAGLVTKTAEEENVTMLPRPADPEKNIAETLKEQVKKEISE